MQLHAQTTRRKTALLTAAVGVLATLVVLSVTAMAPAERVRTIGNVRGKAPPSCPTKKGKRQKECQTMARVTGFQIAANGKKGPMKVRRDGRIVAWSVDMSKPSAEERHTLTDGFDLGDPAAKLSILKPKGKGKFKLTKQSPKVKLKSLLGSEPIFTLKKPLRVKKGTVVAISTGSWVPNLAHHGKLTVNGDKWRASRRGSKCGDNPNKSAVQNRKDLLSGKPQRKVGSVVRYGCTYVQARLLYKAYYVPTKKGGGGGK